MAPGSAYAIEQASDLCYGRLGHRDGLWTACDRNGGISGGRIYRFSPATLAAARDDGSTIVADEEIVVAEPSEGWSAFRKSHASLGTEVLDHIQERVTAGLIQQTSAEAAAQRKEDKEGKFSKLLDLEAITIGVSVKPPHEPRLFVVAEEPFSLILELRLKDMGNVVGNEMGQPTQAKLVAPTQAELMAVYRYMERDDEHGLDFNDGIEGLAYAGSPGRFWWVEEGTRLHKPDAHPRLFFDAPRLGLGEIKEHVLVPIEPVSENLTQAVRRHKQGDQQTLNAVCVVNQKGEGKSEGEGEDKSLQGMLLTLDRNGGWILAADPKTQNVVRWFNLYDISGLNLRERLANFPGPRRMPYVSMEGIALDEADQIWLVDDPAMPEPFRDSCLVRIADMPLPTISIGTKQ